MKPAKLLSAALVLAALLPAAACRDVNQARVRRIGVEAVDIRTFDPSSYLVDTSTGLPTVKLKNVKLFLWLGDLPEVEKVASVKKISNEIERLDDVGFDLTASRLVLETQADSAFLRWETAKTDYDRAERERRKIQRKLDAELAKPEAEQDLGKVEDLKSQLAQAEAILSDATARRAQAEADAASAGLDLDAIALRIEEINTGVAENTAAGQKQVDQLTEVVDFYSQQPDEFRIAFLGGDKIDVQVKGWDTCWFYKALQEDNIADPNLNGEPDEERCRDVRAENASYESFAGRIKFRLVAGTGALFDVDAVRTRYVDRFNRTFFQGRIKATFPREGAEPVIRTGIIKLVDKKNN